VAVADTGAAAWNPQRSGNRLARQAVYRLLRRADEGALSRLLVEVNVVLATGRSNGTNALREAATVYKVDTDAIAKVKQEFAAKAMAKKEASRRLWAQARAVKQHRYFGEPRGSHILFA